MSRDWFIKIGSLKEISKWMGIHKLLASEDASKKKAHGSISEQKIEWKRGEQKAKVFENQFRSGGEENERRMANNVMQGRKVYDGYLVWLDLT